MLKQEGAAQIFSVGQHSVQLDNFTLPASISLSQQSINLFLSLHILNILSRPIICLARQLRTTFIILTLSTINQFFPFTSHLHLKHQLANSIQLTASTCPPPHLPPSSPTTPPKPPPTQPLEPTPKYCYTSSAPTPSTTSSTSSSCTSAPP